MTKLLNNGFKQKLKSNFTELKRKTNKETNRQAVSLSNFPEEERKKEKATLLELLAWRSDTWQTRNHLMGMRSSEKARKPKVPEIAY